MPPHVSRRPLAVGLALGGLYAMVAVATLLFSDRPLLPLFDGLAPPPPYRWVTPPPELAVDNQQPGSADREAPLGPEGSPFLNVTPDDGQVVVVLETGAVPPTPAETGVRVVVKPYDPATLGALPDGMTPAGNAYLVTVVYQPSGTAVSTLRTPTTPSSSSIALTAAGLGDEMLYSADGERWARRPNPEPLVAGHGLRTPFEAPGYYLVSSIDRSEPGGTSPVVYALVLGLPLVAVLVLMPVARKRREAASAEARAAARKRGGRGPAGQTSKRRPPPPGRRGRRSG